MPELQPKNSKHTSTNDCSFVKNNFALLKADTYLAGQPECCACVCLLFSHTKFALTVVLWQKLNTWWGLLVLPQNIFLLLVPIINK